MESNVQFSGEYTVTAVKDAFKHWIILRGYMVYLRYIHVQVGYIHIQLRYTHIQLGYIHIVPSLTCITLHRIYNRWGIPNT